MKNFNIFDFLIKLIIKYPEILLLIPVVIGVIILSTKQKNLETIKNKRVGNNQMGSSRFMNEKDKMKYFKKIEYCPNQWRKNPKSRPEQGMIWGLTGYKRKSGKKFTLLDTSDTNTLLIGPPGIGKTSFFLIPEIEYACASGQRLLITDTKGDIYRKMGQVMKDYYGYNIILIDFRNPVRGDSFNFLQLVNQYNDLAEKEKDEFKKIKYKALAEKNAKVVAETIINSSGGNTGDNAYFYDNAKGILTSTILLISKYGDKAVIDEQGKIIQYDTRHIVSVFKLIQEMSEFETKEDDENLTESKFAKLINKLDENDKTKWFAGSVTKADIKASSNCFSTALTILTKFIDTEIEQILCFDSKFTMEEFVKNKSAIFVTLPEEDTTKHFLFSLLLNQVYGQLLQIADEHYNGKFQDTVRLFLDEFGTLPKIEGIESMFTASRSRNILSVPIIQMFAQLKKYKEGEKAIRDSCKNILFSNFSPISEDAQILSKAMGKYTTQTGSVSRSDRKNSVSYNMTGRELMTADEISRLQTGEFILLRGGTYPCKLDIPLYIKWGIKEGGELVQPQEIRKPRFIDISELSNSIDNYNKSIVENLEKDKQAEKIKENKLTYAEMFNTFEKINCNENEGDKMYMNEKDIEKEIGIDDKEIEEFENKEIEKLEEKIRANGTNSSPFKSLKGINFK